MDFQINQILEPIFNKGEIEGSRAVKMVLRGEEDTKFIIIIGENVTVVNK